MMEQKDRAGRFTLPGKSVTLNRMGYGAMQLAGPGVWGPPKDVNTAIAVLREAVESGGNHIDTSDYYGPHVTNQLIKQALHPYAKDLVMASRFPAPMTESRRLTRPSPPPRATEASRDISCARSVLTPAPRR
jgi:pyridoxine 4-dehydrogenase